MHPATPPNGWGWLVGERLPSTKETHSNRRDITLHGSRLKGLDNARSRQNSKVPTILWKVTRASSPPTARNLASVDPEQRFFWLSPCLRPQKTNAAWQNRRIRLSELRCMGSKDDAQASGRILIGVHFAEFSSLNVAPITFSGNVCLNNEVQVLKMRLPHCTNALAFLTAHTSSPQSQAYNSCLEPSHHLATLLFCTSLYSCWYHSTRTEKRGKEDLGRNTRVATKKQHSCTTYTKEEHLFLLAMLIHNFGGGWALNPDTGKLGQWRSPQTQIFSVFLLACKTISKNPSGQGILVNVVSNFVILRCAKHLWGKAKMWAWGSQHRKVKNWDNILAATLIFFLFEGNKHRSF